MENRDKNIVSFFEKGGTVEITRKCEVSTHESDDVMESVCIRVRTNLELSGASTCYECDKPTCIVKFTRKSND